MPDVFGQSTWLMKSILLSCPPWLTQPQTDLSSATRRCDIAWSRLERRGWA